MAKFKEVTEMLTVGKLKEVIKELKDDVKVGIMESYDPKKDVAEYQECAQLSVLPDEEIGDVLIFSTFPTITEDTEEKEDAEEEEKEPDHCGRE